MAKLRILVIGSKNHNRADCIDWLQPFPNIEEYDSVIMNLQFLSIDILNQLCKSDKLAKMKSEINTLFKTGREVFCIINKLLTSPLSEWKKSSNYDWLNIKLAVNPKRGTSVFVNNLRFSNYMNHVKNWRFELEFGGEALERLGNILVYRLVPIATNKSGKIIACTCVERQYDSEPYVKGYIHLLPPPTECNIHQAIEIIIDLIWGKEEKYVPPWRKDIEVSKSKRNPTKDTTKNTETDTNFHNDSKRDFQTSETNASMGFI